MRSSFTPIEMRVKSKKTLTLALGTNFVYIRTLRNISVDLLSKKKAPVSKQELSKSELNTTP